MDGYPVTTATQMRKLEKAAFQAGESDEEYMLHAGAGIAAILEEALVTPRASDTVHLLIGKGNNGGDAFVAGHKLQQKGFSVIAHHLYPFEECSPLCKKMGKNFVAQGGKRVQLQKAPTFEEGILLDGLLGTGFQGRTEGLISEIIASANASPCPTVAIDIPSGLSGDTGVASGAAIRADVTLYLGLPKIGFFLEDGWDHVGELLRIDFGMPEKYIEDLDPIAHLISEERTEAHLPPIKRTRHKYSTGYVVALAGSPSMPGAAILSTLSSLKAGAGIVRLFHPPNMQEALSCAPYELIREEWDLSSTKRILEELQRARSLLIGPGMGRTSAAQSAIKTLLAETTLPTVIDADALYLLAEDNTATLPPESILTPHHGEMERLLKGAPTLDACQAYVQEKKVTLVLKGAPTIIFHPRTKPLIIPRGDPGMATAGTGDVLTGILAGLLAQGLSPRPAAVLGTLLHAISGELAADAETSYGVIASDLIDHLPEAIQTLTQRRPI